MKTIKTGAMIALAAGSLFAGACKKEEKGAAGGDKPIVGEPMKPTAEVAPSKPAVAPADPVGTAVEKTAKVNCLGVNECKGKSTCKTDSHGCGGQNECKGKGVLEMAEADCSAKGGTIYASK